MTCRHVDLFDNWDNVKRAVACALRKLAELARGRVISVHGRKLSYAMFGKGATLVPIFYPLLLRAVEEVADGCIVDKYVLNKGARIKKIRIIIDKECVVKKLAP